MPVEIRSLDAMWVRDIEVIGRTEMPSLLIRNGYSSVPWMLPRYLTMRSRRVAIWFMTRWSSVMTQSATYSSSPYLVIVRSPRSPVTTAVTPRSLSQRKSLAELRPEDRLVGKAGEEGFERVDGDPLCADLVDHRRRAG